MRLKTPAKVLFNTALRFKNSFTFWIFAGIFFLSFAHENLTAAPKLDIGAEYRLRGIQYSNPTYASEPPIGTGKTTEEKYYSHRARIYMKARLDPGIEIGTVLQAIGVAGSTAPLLNRYPNENFTPFVENIYVQANEIHDWPVNITAGRQPYVWGTGLLIADDGMGFDGLRLDAGPLWGIRTHLFTAKAKEKIGNGDMDLHLAGLSYSWGIHNIKLGWILQDDRSGSSYSNLSSTNPIASDKIQRQYYSINVGGKLEKGAFYQAEYAMQSGKAQIPGKEFTLSGSALTFEGGFDFLHPRYKRMILAFVFMQGSGDNSGSRDDDEKFNPAFGHKFDGLEHAGYGEFFAGTPYTFFNEDKVIVPILDNTGKVIQAFPYTSLFSGLRMFGFRGSINPWEPFIAGLEFYIFNAREIPDIRNGAPTTLNDNELGRELVISGSYLYAKRIQVAIRWGKFFPAQNLNNIGSSRLMFEVSGKF